MESFISIKGKFYRIGVVGGNIFEEILWDLVYYRYFLYRFLFFLIIEVFLD